MSMKNLKECFEDIGNAIRRKTGKTEKIKPINMAIEINSINVEGIADFQEKTVTPSAIRQVVTADAGFDALGRVIVEPIPEEYVIPNGTKTVEIDVNGEYSFDVADYKNIKATVGIFPENVLQEEISVPGLYIYDVTDCKTAEITVAPYTPNGTTKAEFSVPGVYYLDVAGYKTAEIAVAPQGGIQLNNIHEIETLEEMFNALYTACDNSIQNIIKYVGNETEGTFQGETLVTFMGMDLYTEVELHGYGSLYMHTLTLDENGNYTSKLKYIGQA